MIPGFTAETTLSRSRTQYSTGVASAYAGGNSVTPAFWKEIGNFFSSIAPVACRAGCWAAGGALASACTVETVGAGVQLCAAAAGALASTCSDAC
jgi:hypothetical protein